MQLARKGGRRMWMDSCCLTHVHTVLSVCLIQRSPRGNTIFVFALIAPASVIPWQTSPHPGTCALARCTSQEFLPLATFHRCHAISGSPLLVAPLTSTFGCSCAPYCLFAVSPVPSLQKAANAHFGGGGPACRRR